MQFFIRKKHTFASDFIKEGKEIFSDILYAYKNFLHLSISRLIISFWGIVLGLLFFIPIFLIFILVSFIDPINWSGIISYILQGSDITVEMISGLAMHPYWLVLNIILLFTAFAAFMFASSYSLFLISKLALSYIKRKPLAYKKNLYFSRIHITKFITIFCLNFTYLLGPFIILIGLIFFLYFFINIGYISDGMFATLSVILAIIFIATLIYVSFRILFGYIILADSKKKKNLGSARFYVFESIKLTKGSHIVKFIIILIVYAIVVAPFYGIQDHIERKAIELQDALTFYSQDIKKIDEEDKLYYNYIVSEYKDITNIELEKKLGIYSILSIIYALFLYFLLSGMFVVLMTSFYKRILSN